MENPLDRKGLTLSCVIGTYRFYSVQCQTILLVNGEPLGRKGLPYHNAVQMSPLLTLSCPIGTFRFYSFQRQSILLVNGEPLGQERVNPKLY